MSIIIIATIIFVLLSFAALFTMNFHYKLPLHHRSDETNNVVRLIANIFVVMTSLVFGLMMNSSKNTYEAIDKNVHAFATEIIVLDRSLRNYGPETAEARNRLKAYVKGAIENPTRGSNDPQKLPDETGKLLDLFGKSLAKIQPSTHYADSMLMDIRQQYHSLLEQRWALIEQSEGSMPMPIIAMLTAWLLLIFASYGYRAPKNAVTISMVIVSAGLISASIYLILDMDKPFSGPIQISDMTLKRALAEINSEQ